MTEHHMHPMTARRLAFKVLNAVSAGRQTLDDAIHANSDFIECMKQRDRALFNALVHGVLRWRGRLDYLIAHFSNIALSKMDPRVLNLIRLGLFQIIYLDRIPVSAAVNTGVEIAKSDISRRVGGFVNAVLRQASEHVCEVRFPNADEDPIEAMASRQSFPQWLLKRWLQRFDRDTVLSLCKAINHIPPIGVRTNTLRLSAAELEQSLSQEVDRLWPMTYAPEGLCLVGPRRPIPQLNAFKKGWFQVQDEAAQLVALLLDPQPGETVLDACAGLGGKTGHIAQLMKNKGRVLAVDRNTDKLDRLQIEMERLGISIAVAQGHDLTSPLKPLGFSQFDRVLLDAPCSGLGVLRRNPDIKWAVAKQDFATYQKKQLQCLENVAGCIKMSGVLVYAVCSVEPEENEQVIEAFLKNRPEFAMDNNPGQLPTRMLNFGITDGGIRTHPLFTEMDGFYMVRLQRVK
jgi:16S rRNA (cytosine967-C5)-methyltransferase